MDGKVIPPTVTTDNNSLDATTTAAIDDRMTLSDYIYPAIQKQYIAIVTHADDVLNDGEIEAVHQMRVSLRRLRSLLQAFAPIVVVPPVMGDRRIGKIAKILGKVRDLDVLEHTCENYHANLPDAERVLLSEVIVKIAKRRRKAIGKVREMLVDRDYQYFKLALNNWLNHPQYTQTIAVPIESILPSLLLSSVGKLLLAPGWWVDFQLEAIAEPEVALTQLIQTHGTTIHSLRKQVKATRYLLELFPDRYSPAYTTYLQDLKQIHQLLGSLQDSAVLATFIQRVLGKRAATKLPQLRAQIASQNYGTWQEWQPLQHQYQLTATKHKFQSLLMQVTIHNS